MEFKINKNYLASFIIGVILLLILVFYYYPKIFTYSKKIYQKYVSPISIKSLAEEKKRINILFFSENYKEKKNRLRNLYLASYEPVTEQLSVIYIPKDTKFSSMKSKKEQNDISEIYNKKGIKTLVKEFENNFNISIPFFISFKENGFEKLLNLIGGLEINVLDTIKYVENNEIYLLKTGQQFLFPPKIIEYITYQKKDENNDIDLIYRQQNFLKVFIETISQEKNLLNTKKAIEIIYDLLDETNINKSDLEQIIMIIYKLKSYNIQMAKIPGEIIKYDENEFLAPDILAVKNILPKPYEELIADDEIDDRITVRILNSLKISGLAGKLREKFLDYYDIDVVELGNYKTKTPYTIINSYSNNYRSAQRIKEILTVGKIVDIKNSNDLIDIEIIIGEDYKEYLK